MQGDERQGQPEHRQQFEVRDVGDSKGIEAEDQPADGACGVAARQHPRQRVRRERGQRERGQQGDVVSQHGRAAHPLDRTGEKGQTDAERPRAEKRIAQVVRDSGRELTEQVAEERDGRRRKR